MTNSLVHDLDLLHADYVASVNAAVAQGDLRVAEDLAASYETEAVQMMAEREGLTHLLPLTRPTVPSRLRRLVGLVSHQAA